MLNKYNTIIIYYLCLACVPAHMMMMMIMMMRWWRQLQRLWLWIRRQQYSQHM